MAVVDRDVYNRMKAQANRAYQERTNAYNEACREKNRLDQLLRESAGLSAEDLRTLNAKFDEANRIIQDDLEELREEFGKELGKQAVQTQKMLEEVRKLAADNRIELDGVISKAADLENQLHEGLKRHTEQIESKKKRAMLYYEQYEGLLKQILALFPEKYEALYPEILQPGIDVLQKSEKYILDDLQQGDYEAALGIAQTRIPEAISMLGNLNVFHDVFLETMEATKKALDQVDSKLDAMSSEKETKLSYDSGREYCDKFGAQYWAVEIFDEILNKLLQSEAEIEEYLESHDAENLKLTEQRLEQIKNYLIVCERLEEKERNLHYVGRELLINLYIVLNQNDTKKWGKPEIHKNESDLRESMYVVIERTDGFRIVATCLPERTVDLEQNWNCQCKLEVFDQGDEKDDIERCRIVYEHVISILKNHGIPIIEETSDIGKLEINSESFIQGTANFDVQKRENWLSHTKQAMGLALS